MNITVAEFEQTWQRADTLMNPVTPICIAVGGFVVQHNRSNGQAFHMLYKRANRAHVMLARVRVVLPAAEVLVAEALMDEHANTTRCRCGHTWRPVGWQEGTRNCTCPLCGGWNQAGKRHPLYGTRMGARHRAKHFSAGGKIKLKGRDT